MRPDVSYTPAEVRDFAEYWQGQERNIVIRSVQATSASARFDAAHRNAVQRFFFSVQLAYPGHRGPLRYPQRWVSPRFRPFTIRWNVNRYRLEAWT